MKYWVREDKGLRTVDVAVPGTSTCSGGVVRVLGEDHGGTLGEGLARGWQRHPKCP